MGHLLAFGGQEAGVLTIVHCVGSEPTNEELSIKNAFSTSVETHVGLTTLTENKKADIQKYELICPRVRAESITHSKTRI